MFETAGTLTIVELVSSLVALVLLPLLWAFIAALSAIRRTNGREACRIAIALSGGAFALAITHAVRAAQMPAGHEARQFVAQLARIGQLDLSIDLVRDSTSAALAVLVTFLAFAAVLHAVWTTEGLVAGRLAWIGLAASSTMLVVLADGLTALAVGLQLATLAGWAAAGVGRSRPLVLVLALAGDTAVVFAAWILFWSLGGVFTTSGYTPDPLPRFAIVALPDAPRADAKATVSLTTYVDALVSSDDGPPLPGEPLRSPFTLTLDPGTYSFRIEASAATPDLLLTHVTLASGRAYVLTPYGPTTSLRNLDDQLAVSRPSPTGPLSMRAVLAARTITGLPIGTLLSIVAVIAALLRLALLATSKGGGLAYALESVPAFVLVMHIAPLVDVDRSGGSAATLAIVPALASVIFAANAAASSARDDVSRSVLASLTALALASVLLGETAGALVLVVVSSLAGAAITAALDAGGDKRWLGVACAGLAGVVPGCGSSPCLVSAIGGAFGESARGRWAGSVVAPLFTLAIVVVSLAVFRMYVALIRSPVPRGGGWSKSLATLLAGTSLVGGAALGAGSSSFGGHTLPLARRLVSGTGGLDGAPRIAFAALGLSLAAAAIGLVASLRAMRIPHSPPPWIAALGVPRRILSRVVSSAASLVRFFVGSVVIMNEDVVDDVTEVIVGAVERVGAGLRRLDTVAARGMFARLFGMSAGVTAGDSGGVVRTDMDEPRPFDRLRMGLVIGMVTALGLVVLSSMVLS